MWVDDLSDLRVSVDLSDELLCKTNVINFVRCWLLRNPRGTLQLVN